MNAGLVRHQRESLGKRHPCARIENHKAARKGSHDEIEKHAERVGGIIGATGQKMRKRQKVLLGVEPDRDRKPRSDRARRKTRRSAKLRARGAETATAEPDTGTPVTATAKQSAVTATLTAMNLVIPPNISLYLSNTFDTLFRHSFRRVYPYNDILSNKSKIKISHYLKKIYYFDIKKHQNPLEYPAYFTHNIFISQN